MGFSLQIIKSRALIRARLNSNENCWFMVNTNLGREKHKIGLEHYNKKELVHPQAAIKSILSPCLDIIIIRHY